MLCVVFGVVILGNNMKPDQSVVGRWQAADLLLCFFDNSLRGGTDCHSLGFGQSVHSGGWILDHTDMSDVQHFLLCILR